MKRVLVLTLSAVVFCVAAGSTTVGGQKDKEKDAALALALEMKLLDGIWQLVSHEIGGQKQDLQNNTIQTTVKDGKYSVQVGDKVVETGSFRIDPTTKPKSIDALPDSGDRKGKTLVAVYDVAGDELRMCVAQDGGTRPQELASKQGTTNVLNTYKRQPPPKQ